MSVYELEKVSEKVNVSESLRVSEGVFVKITVVERSIDTSFVTETNNVRSGGIVSVTEGSGESMKECVGV